MIYLTRQGVFDSRLGWTERAVHRKSCSTDKQGVHGGVSLSKGDKEVWQNLTDQECSQCDFMNTFYNGEILTAYTGLFWPTP